MVIGHAQKAQLKARVALTGKVRALRKERGWTQAELAARLQLSQGRLSQIERGGGSFTAEQFLEILKLFNVTTDHFVPAQSAGDAALQNAVARLGASHLRESSEVLPSQRLQNVSDVVREVLVSADSPRLITSLAPVLVYNSDLIQLPKLNALLADAGLDRRLGWLVDNVLEAIRRELPNTPAPLAKRYRRAELVLEAFLDLVTASESARASAPKAIDVLDPGIRSKKTVAEVTASASAISRRWSIVTALQPEDFVEALRAARVAG